MEYLKALLEVAYRLGYDGLPPGDGGPVIDPARVKEITLEVEAFLMEEFKARAARG